MNIPSECRSANIVRDHAMILPDDATPKPDEIFGKDRDAERREQGQNGDELLHDTSPFSTGAVRQGHQSLSVLPMQRWKHWYPLITMLLGCPHSYIRYVSSSLVAWTDAVQS